MNADFFKIGWKKKKKTLHKQNTRIARISRDQKNYVPFCSDHLHEDYIEKKICPSNSGHTSGQIFFRLQKIFDLSSVSIVKSGAQTFWVYGSRPSDPSKWGKIGLLLPFCPLCPKLRSHEWANLFPSSKNFSS